tara:strand:- start:3438 stop:3671 length:234 start_codon:yes stop_codon:yes gene_type:complete
MITWFIYITLTIGDPFVIKTLKFDSKQECVKYVNDPSNADVLAIETIAVAGFNDPMTAILCLPETQNLIKDTRKNAT